MYLSKHIRTTLYEAITICISAKTSVLSLYIQRCNHDRSATQNLTPISRCFKYIFSHFYPYFAQNGYKLAFKKHPYISHSKYTFTKPPLFSQFQVHFY